MYNSELKSKFIAEYTSAIEMAKSCVTFFDFTEKFEAQRSADLCTFSAADLQQVADNMMTARSGGSRTRLSILRKYLIWCMSHGIDGARNEFQKIIVSNLDKIKRSMFSGPLQLQKFLNSALSPESEQQTDNCTRCIFWLIYGGMKIENLNRVLVSDVKLEDMIVSYDGDEYPIYREGMAAFKNCKRLTQFLYTHHSAAGNDYEVMRDRCAGKELIRGVRSVPSIATIRSLITKTSVQSSESTGVEVRYSNYNVWLSGLFFRMYETEQYVGHISFIGAANDLVQGKKYKYGDVTEEKRKTLDFARRNNYAKQYLMDYQNWKDAFDLN